MSEALTISQTTHNGKVIDFNQGGEEFTEEEKQNLNTFLTNPNNANAERLSTVVRDATPEDEKSKEAMKGADFWQNNLADLNAKRPKEEDYDMNDPTQAQQYAIDMKEYTASLSNIKTILEMYNKAVGGWGDHARKGVQDLAF